MTRTTCASVTLRINATTVRGVMKLLPRWVICSALAFLALTALPTAADAKSASPYCNLLVGKSVNGANSPVLASACADTAQAAMTAYQAKLSKLNKGNGLSPNVSSNVPIVLLYANQGYSGNYTNVWGSSGPCDTAGYRIDMYAWSDYWAHNTSSMQGLNSCNQGTMGTSLNGTDYYNTRCQPMYGIGIYDNQLYSLHVQFNAGCP